MEQLSLPLPQNKLLNDFLTFYQNLVAFQATLHRTLCETCEGRGNDGQYGGHNEGPNTCYACNGFGYLVSHDGKRYYARNATQGGAYEARRRYDLY